MAKHTNLQQSVAAVLLTALDGHNPNLEHKPDGTIVAHSGRGKSDLEMTIEELIDLPVHPKFTHRALAQEAVYLIRWIAYRHGITHEELVQTFQRNVQGHVAGQADG